MNPLQLKANPKRLTRAVKVLGIAACLAAPAGAQQSGRDPNPNTAQVGGQNSGGVIPLPKGVRNVVSIDAHNTLLAEVEDATGEGSEYVQMPVQHVYSGGIARVLGGTVVPTEQFVSPAFNKQGGFGNNNFQGAQQGFNGGNGFGANNGFGNGLGNFGNNGYGNFGNTTVTGPNGATVTRPNFGGVMGSGQFAPQSFAPQSTLNRQQARLSINSGNRQLNQVLGLLDRPLRQVEVGASFGSTNTSSSR